MTKEGAVNNQLMLATCRNDQEDELGKLLEEGTCDPNFVDGAGNTAAHYAAKAGSIGCLELLVNEDDIDLDVKNRLEGDTPLHKAVQFQNDHAETAYIMAELLIAGGADPRIVNRNKLTPSALVNPNNKELKKLLEDAVASYQFDESDFVGNHDDDSDDDQPSD